MKIPRRGTKAYARMEAQRRAIADCALLLHDAGAKHLGPTADRPWSLLTRGGVLRVCDATFSPGLADGFMHLAFDDPERAKIALFGISPTSWVCGLNVHSGKWNIHAEAASMANILVGRFVWILDRSAP